MNNVDKSTSTPLPLQQSTISRRVQLVFLTSVFLVGLTIIRYYHERQVFSEILQYTQDAPVQTATTTTNTNRNRSTTTTTTTSLLENSEETLTENNNNNNNNNNTPIELWRKKRVAKEIYDSWFVGEDGHGNLAENADAQGPILDFVIAGFPKCGTTAMMKLLAPVTTMPSNQDVCTPMENTIYYSYINWSIEFGNGAHNYTEKKPLRGNKCPRYLEGPVDLKVMGEKLPKTKLIVGIRHPVLWFQSFTNMMWHNSGRAERVKSGSNETLADFVAERQIGLNQVKHECAKHRGRATTKVCVPRSRFHLSLARLGKTPLDQNEIDLLQSEIRQATVRLNDTYANPRDFPFSGSSNNVFFNVGVPNKIFLYESSQGKEEYFYQNLANFLEFDRTRLPALDNTVYRSGNGLNNLEKSLAAAADKENSFDICLPEYDAVRKELLPISYTLGQWLKQYLIPASHQRDDLTIPNVTAFESIIETFLRDPCQNRLVRNDDDGEYYLAEKENATNS